MNPVFVFLDFDGVLHRFFPLEGESDQSNAHFAFRPAFEDAIRACKRPVKIVIASTWRRKHDLSYLRSLFSSDIGPMVVGVTPIMNGGSSPGGRLKEVQEWLKENASPDSDWVGVDDFPSLYGAGAVVACQDGFFDRERALLIEAVADPVQFAVARPCTSSSEQGQALVLVEGVSVRPRS